MVTKEIDEQYILDFVNKRYPIKIQKVKKLTNEMYHCSGVQGNYYARFTGYKSYNEQVEEITWMSFLLEKGVNVAPVVPSIEGNKVEVTTTHSKEVCFVLFKEAQGRHLSRSEWNAEVLKEVGREIGKLHKATKEYNYPIVHIKDWFHNEECQFLTYIPEEETTIRSISQAIKDEIMIIPANRENYGLLHGDVWLENILIADNLKPTFIDFQDCEKHYFLYDLAVPLYSALEFSFAGSGNILDYGRSIKDALLEGYSEMNTLPCDVDSKLPLFMKLKEIFEYNLMHMYWPEDRRREEHIRIMNLYRQRLESEYDLI